MDKPFEIRFDFPLEHSSYSVALKARVQVHSSQDYYAVDSFFFETTNQSKEIISILPGVEIKYLKTDKKGTWVHKDSERESLLSRAIGEAIEKVHLPKNNLLYE
ncbi:MAG TPA: hypothetical protein VJU78_13575 [Chitinophagaceae bacterium]|nr:hypothetical protein [Chitinophagaceae bacterium]